MKLHDENLQNKNIIPLSSYEDKTFQDRCVIPLSTFESKGINCYKKIPLDDRLSPETIRMFPKERFATLYRSARLSDYIMLNVTYEQLSVMNVKTLSVYSIELLNILHDKFYNHKENTTEYAIDKDGNLYSNPNAKPLYKKIEAAILEKQKYYQKVKKQRRIIKKVNEHIQDKNYVITPTEAQYLLNISASSYTKYINNNDFFKNKKEITANELLTSLEFIYNGDSVIYQFERLYKTVDLERRYNYAFRGSTFFVNIQEKLPYITFFSKKYYRETDVLKFDEFMYQRYAVLPEKDL